MSDGNSDTTRPRPNIRETQRTAPRPSPLHGALHQGLGVGIGHQYVRRHLELQAHEFLPAGEVSDGCALATPGDQVPVGRQLRLGERALELQVEVKAPDPKRMRQQQLGVKAGR